MRWRRRRRCVQCERDGCTDFDACHGGGCDVDAGSADFDAHADSFPDSFADSQSDLGSDTRTDADADADPHSDAVTDRQPCADDLGRADHEHHVRPGIQLRADCRGCRP
jgi:hypothetical protein